MFNQRISRARSAFRSKALLSLAASVALTLVALPCLGQSLLGMEYVETKSTTIGPNGELFHIQAGMHLDLFPEDPAAGWNTVLALDVVRDGELAERLVIPGTESFEIESDAALLADGNRLFILWMSRAGAELSSLELISFEADTSSFGSKVDVSGDPLPLKGRPDLAITRETVWLPAHYNAEGEQLAAPTTATRTVVHVLWWEEDLATTQSSVYYAPIVLTDGAFLGWNPVVQLSPEFFGITPQAPATPGWSQDLLHAPSLDQGTDARSLVIGLPAGSNGVLYNTVVRLLPEGLAAIAEEARSHIIGVGLIQTGGAGGAGPDYIDVAEAARSHIIGVGRVQLHQGVREFVANKVAARIVAFGEAQAVAGALFDPAVFEELAAETWAEAMAAGASLLGNQLRSADLSCGVLHLGATGPVTLGSESTESLHQVEFCISSTHTLPATTAVEGSEHRIVTSEDGTQALVVWQDQDGTVSYRRTEATLESGWTETQVVPDTELDLNLAVALLRSQVRIR